MPNFSRLNKKQFFFPCENHIEITFHEKYPQKLYFLVLIKRLIILQHIKKPTCSTLAIACNGLFTKIISSPWITFLFILNASLNQKIVNSFYKAFQFTTKMEYLNWTLKDKIYKTLHLYINHIGQLILEKLMETFLHPLCQVTLLYISSLKMLQQELHFTAKHNLFTCMAILNAFAFLNWIWQFRRAFLDVLFSMFYTK